ncbi:MAG: hypothetical protein WDO13_18660 [Verrucomicrobiota bacterium]
MPLSKSDQQFYEEKLSLKSFGRLFLVTAILGAVAWPALLFVTDWQAGQAANWTAGLVINVATVGFLLGTVVSVVMYLGFKFLLQMGWLPSRR